MTFWKRIVRDEIIVWVFTRKKLTFWNLPNWRIRGGEGGGGGGTRGTISFIFMHFLANSGVPPHPSGKF